MHNYITIESPTEQCAKNDVYKLWNESNQNTVRWRRPDGTLAYLIEYANDCFEWCDSAYVVGWPDDLPNFSTITVSGLTEAETVTYQLWDSFVCYQREDGTRLYPDLTGWSEESNWPTEPHVPFGARFYILIQE